MPRQDIDALLTALTRGFDNSRNAGRRYPDAALGGATSNATLLRTVDIVGSAHPDDNDTDNMARQHLIDELNSLNRQVDQLRSVQQSGLELTQENTQALAQNTSVKASSGESPVKSFGRGLASIFTSGFGFAPMIGSLLGLFGNRREEEPTPLVSYTRPAPLRVERAITDSGFQSFDHDQTGALRPIATTGTTTAAQVTVNVQTMDSQSFLDHRGEIAKAIREALLESQPLSDVLAEL